MAQTVKSQPAMLETWVRSLGWEDLLEKEMATHSSLLTWEIPWTEEPGGLHSMGSQSRTRLKRLSSSSSSFIKSSSGGSVVKNPPAMQET